jgi:signal peptidase II
VWGIAVGVLLADQVTKGVALATHPSSGASGGGWISLRLVRNTGASFGLGSGHPVVITLVAVVLVAAVVIALLRTRSTAVALALAVVLGGAAGNLADRLFRSPGPGRGAVVDWIHVAGYSPSFNLADLAIRAGAVAALLAFGLASRTSGAGSERQKGRQNEPDVATQTS